MKTINVIVNVPEERVITVKLPQEVSPGEHRIVMVIDEAASLPSRQNVFKLEGLWAGGKDVSSEDISEARRKMWGRLGNGTEE